jgi:electron transfer flavoprotein-quinone oxidoreductase
LSAYRAALERSFTLQDLRRYRKIPDLLATHPQFFSLYPAVLNEAAHEILTVDGKSKEEKIGLIKKRLFQRLPRRAILRDLFHLWRAFR